jgi:HPr kinase/phosphorylase
MAMGAHLIADDQTTLTVTDAGLVASCPSPIAGVIEARGIGLLTATPLPMARITLVADLGQTETDRLPPFRSVTLLGTVLPLVLGQKSPHFPAGLLCYLHGGRYG